MPVYKNYLNDYRKNSKKKEDLFSVPKNSIKSSEMEEKRKNNIIDWVTLYRRNVHVFVSHYFGIKLYFFQKIWIYLMGTRDSYVAIASRGVSKTWLLAVLALARAVLYPGSEIVLVAATKQQAGTLVEDKVTSLRDNYPNIAREIKNLTTNMNKWQVDFHNGSVIRVVAARDSSRGKRSTFTIFEEFPHIPKEVLDSVIRPFSYIRQAPYLKNPEWSQYGEEPREVFISSAFHKGLWWYEETKRNIIDMLNGKNSGFIAFDIRVCIEHNVKSRSQLIREMDKADPIVVLEEYYNIPAGESSTSYFKLKHFTRARKIEGAFYPQNPENYNPKKNPYGIKKTNGEIRIVACDVAQRAGKKNDLSITWCIRLLPTHKGYFREVVYGESFSGVNSIKQTLRIKQVFHDFDADVLVLDVGAGGGGIPMYDQLGQITKDTERGIEYPAMTIMQHDSIDDSVYEELSKRTLALDATPNIYCISPTAKLNSFMAVDMKDKMQKKMIGLLVNESRAEDYLLKTRPGEYNKIDDATSKSFFMQPYVQTSLLINEAIGVSGVLTAGNIKLVEPSGARKDRIITLMMGNYYASFLDADILRDEKQEDDLDSLMAVTLFS